MVVLTELLCWVIEFDELVGRPVIEYSNTPSFKVTGNKALLASCDASRLQL